MKLNHNGVMNFTQVNVNLHEIHGFKSAKFICIQTSTMDAKLPQSNEPYWKILCAKWIFLWCQLSARQFKRVYRWAMSKLGYELSLCKYNWVCLHLWFISSKLKQHDPHGFFPLHELFAKAHLPENKWSDDVVYKCTSLLTQENFNLRLLIHYINLTFKILYQKKKKKLSNCMNFAKFDKVKINISKIAVISKFMKWKSQYN